MAFYLKDIEYDDLRDVAPSGVVTKGTCQLINDVFGFWIKDAYAGAETTFVYKAKQVLADKVFGTGFGINSGDAVFASAAGVVSKVKDSTFVYYVGTAKETVDGDATQVLINFDGSIPLENDIS